MDTKNSRRCLICLHHEGSGGEGGTRSDLSQLLRQSRHSCAPVSRVKPLRNGVLESSVFEKALRFTCMMTPFDFSPSPEQGPKGIELIAKKHVAISGKRFVEK